jgi:hypothetical protein
VLVRGTSLGGGVSRPMLRAGALAWAVVAALVTGTSLGDVNSDAVLFVAAASVVGVLCAVSAVVLLGRGSDRGAGLLLVASAIITPTYFAYALAVPALVVGIVLAVKPRVLPQMA